MRLPADASKCKGMQDFLTEGSGPQEIRKYDPDYSYVGKALAGRLGDLQVHLAAASAWTAKNCRHAKGGNRSDLDGV